MRKIKYFVPYFRDVVDISISLKDLGEVFRHCSNRRRLTLKLNVSTKQNYKDAFLCIRNLGNLNKLILEGEHDRFEETK